MADIISFEKARQRRADIDSQIEKIFENSDKAFRKVFGKEVPGVFVDEFFTDISLGNAADLMDADVICITDAKISNDPIIIADIAQNGAIDKATGAPLVTCTCGNCTYTLLPSGVRCVICSGFVHYDDFLGVSE